MPQNHRPRELVATIGSGRGPGIGADLFRLSLQSLLLLAISSASRAEGPAPGAGGTSFSPQSIEFFESKVRPILADHCLKCHGDKKQSAGLRLDSREGTLKGGDSGPAVVTAKPDESLLVQAVARTHAELKMPPAGKLAEPSIAVLRQWVAEGAPWPAANSLKAGAASRPALRRQRRLRATGRFGRSRGRWFHRCETEGGRSRRWITSFSHAWNRAGWNPRQLPIGGL